jgi:hypothetical protein
MTDKELKKKLNVIIDQLDSVSTDLARANCDDKFANEERIRDWFNRIHTTTSSLIRIVKDKV